MSQPKSQNIHWHGANITKDERQALLNSKGCVVWFTGLSGSGKSTIARCVEHLLLERSVPTYVLDGDNIRFGLNKDLGFSPADRTENIRRIGEVAKLFADASVVTLTAFISPYRADRDQVRAIMTAGEFFEVYIDTPIEVCEQRDPKGLYKKARAGQIPEFTGISAPYEEPVKPELVVKSEGQTVEQSAAVVINFLASKGFVREA
jgi:adenylylsulfate kinase